MVAVAVRAIGADRRPVVGRARGATDRDEPADHFEAAAVDPRIDSARFLAAGGYAVDRAAQRARAEAQGIGAAIDLEVIEDGRFELLKVAVVVGQVDRHAILQQRQPAHVEAARQARAADGNAHFLAEARLGIDAGREGQRVAQRNRRLVGIVGIGDDVGAAGGAGGALFGFARGGLADHDDRAALRVAIGVIVGKRRRRERGRERQGEKGCLHLDIPLQSGGAHRARSGRARLPVV